MKVQCDVCSRDEASVFCCADEAALCAACDLRVHRANKVAGKHRRFSLSSPSSLQSHHAPVCDICQEKRGFVFCQQDRAILCRDCDGPIHSANDLTMKHSRFLLTGIRLSSVPIPESQELPTNGSMYCADHGSLNETNSEKSATETGTSDDAAAAAASAYNGGSSSISEYLTKMLPGYCVEDLLVDDAVTADKDAFYKSNELIPFIGADLDCGGGGFGAGAEELPVWVPHLPQAPRVSVHNYQRGPGAKAAQQQSYGVRMGRERWSDESFMVPQLNLNNTGSVNSKRHRTSSVWDFLDG